MKYQNLAASIAALALSSTAGFANTPNAADSKSSAAASTVASTDSSTAPSAAPSADTKWLVDASKLDGTTIYDFHGNKLGALHQVLIDPQSGRIRYGVLEVDKSWSMSDPEIAVPWGSFAVKKGDNKAVKLSLDASKDKLEKAPKFKAGDADRLFDKQQSEPVYSYWSIYWFDEPMNNKEASGKAGSTDKSSKSDSSVTPPAPAPKASTTTTAPQASTTTK